MSSEEGGYRGQGRDWLFRQFLGALTDDELCGLVEWTLYRMRCWECGGNPCQEACPRRVDSVHLMRIISKEIRRRPRLRQRVKSLPDHELKPTPENSELSDVLE